MNPATGSLARREIIPNPANPSWLALDTSHTHLYSANETADGSASAYAITPSTGHLTLLNTVSSRGAGPAHLSIHPSGKYVLVANYAGGTVAVLPILSKGNSAPPPMSITTKVRSARPTPPAHRPGASPSAATIVSTPT